MRIVLFIALLAVAAGLIEYESKTEEVMVHSKSRHLALAAQEIYGMPASRQPIILWNHDESWNQSAEANCADWTITVSYPTAKHSLDIVLQKVMPHEYGHLVHCFQHGTVGANPHGPRWQNIVINLGGDPSFR